MSSQLLRDLVAIAEESAEHQRREIRDEKKFGGRDSAADLASSLRADLSTIRKARREIARLEGLPDQSPCITCGAYDGDHEKGCVATLGVEFFCRSLDCHNPVKSDQDLCTQCKIGEAESRLS